MMVRNILFRKITMIQEKNPSAGTSSEAGGSRSSRELVYIVSSRGRVMLVLKEAEAPEGGW